MVEDDCFVIAIGSSAGGLDALGSFVKGLPAKEENFAIVILQHLSPDYTSRLSEILQHDTSWPVVEISQNMQVKKGLIFVTPPNHHLIIRGKHLQLQDYQNTKPVPSINRFFKSLAENFGSRSIGIILSGTGKDGMEGMLAIKKANGYTIVQNPSNAQHQGMPDETIDNNAFDEALSIHEMPLAILQYIKDFELINKNLELEKISGIDATGEIFKLLEKRTGTNFSLYKSSTIKRRINKRLEAKDISNYQDYLAYLKKNPKELDTLFETVLIGVTEFFRDPSAFESLKKFINSIIDKKKQGQSVRIWSAGTATGEEAYTIAILLTEANEKSGKDLVFQIFGTDIDEKAIQKARRGIYGMQSSGSIPDHLLHKYFKVSSDSIEVKKNIRSLVTFSKHDITRDPPFLNIDLIICRNLLIYLNSDIQKKITPTFNYALNPNGYLFLGKSEGTNPRSELFEQVDKNGKIFQKSKVKSKPWTLFRDIRPRKEEVEETPASNPEPSILEMAKEAYFNQFPYPYVIIDNDLEILEVHGSMKLYTDLKEGASSMNLLSIINKDLSMLIRSMLSVVRKNNSSELSPVKTFRFLEREHAVQIRIIPVFYSESRNDLFMVIFEEVERGKNLNIEKENIDHEQIASSYIEGLEHELKSTKEHLQLFTEELETSNEELQSLNEELQSANEELKLTNEEMETANEELQSANEELNITNKELRFSNSELIKKEEQLQKSKSALQKSQRIYKLIAENFPASLGIVNKDRRIEFIEGIHINKYKLNTKEIVGRKVDELNPDPVEKEKINRLFEMAFQGYAEKEEVSFRKQHLSINAYPLFYDESSSQVEKVIYFTNNITDYRTALDQLSESESRFRLLADDAPIMIWMEDEKMNNIYCNKGWLEYTGSSLENNLGNGWLQFVHPEDKAAVGEEFRKKFEARENYSAIYRLKSGNGDYRWIRDRGVPRYEGNKFVGYIGGCLDIHEQKEQEARKDEFFRIASHELKTPISSINGYIQLIEEVFPDHPEMVQNYLKKTIKSLTRLNRLVNELFDISRIQTKNLPIILNKCDLNELINDALELNALGNREIKKSGKISTHVALDYDRMLQVFENLLSNAHKYSNPEEPILLVLSETEEYACVSIRDTGIGIDLKEKENLFKRYYRINDKANVSGIGLGLYIAKHIVDMHNGSIEVESEKGKGTTFTVKVPKNQPEV